jgi:hypothetical protein
MLLAAAEGAAAARERHHAAPAAAVLVLHPWLVGSRAASSRRVGGTNQLARTKSDAARANRAGQNGDGKQMNIKWSAD